MALPPAREGEKSLVISRLSGESFVPFFYYADERETIRELDLANHAV